MTHSLDDTSASKRVGLAVGSCVLMVYGIYSATTAYGFWGSWLLAAIAFGLGFFGFVSVARTEANRGGWMRLPIWLLGLGGVTVLAAALLGVFSAVCGGETGFSCGG